METKRRHMQSHVRTCAHALQRTFSEGHSALPASQSTQLEGHGNVHAKGGSLIEMPYPTGHAEQPKPSVHAPALQFKSLQLRHFSCSTQKRI